MKITTVEPHPEKQAPPRAADYAPALVARFRLVAETPAADFRPDPVKAEVVRWDLKMPGPGSVYARLVAALPAATPLPSSRSRPASRHRVLTSAKAPLVPPAPFPAFGVRP
ncbi:hypothetical protein [Methylobacterium sp. CM6247]